MNAARRPKSQGGLYCSKLRGSSRAAYEEIAGRSLSLNELNEQAAIATHAKILARLEDAGNEPYRIADRKILQACDLLIEAGDPDITLEYREYLRTRLTELTVFQLATLAGDLAKTSAAINVNATKQLAMCEKVFKAILGLNYNPSTAIILAAMRELVADCGMDINLHDSILASAGTIADAASCTEGTGTQIDP